MPTTHQLAAHQWRYPQQGGLRDAHRWAEILNPMATQTNHR